jgi:hypothetical protein
MPQQIDLDFTALARSSDPETSHAAAASLNTTEMEGMVLSALQMLPEGATTIQIARALNLAPWSISPRMKPLCAKGFVMDSTRRLKGSSGRNSIVWILVPRH